MKRIFSVAALAFALAVTGPALAQQQQAGQQQQTQGTIESFRVVDVEGQRDDHLIVRVTPQQGQRDQFTYIDLGSARQLQEQNVRVERDQDILAIGYVGRIAGIPVLVAERFEIEGQRFARAGQQQRQMAQQHQGFAVEQPRQRGVRLVKGEVKSMKDFSIKGVKDKHRLIKVKDAQTDRTFIVDLGSQKQAKALDLSEGDRVLVQGIAGRAEGKPILQAHRIAKVMTIEQPKTGEQQQQRMSRHTPQLRQQQQQQSR